MRFKEEQQYKSIYKEIECNYNFFKKRCILMGRQFLYFTKQEEANSIGRYEKSYAVLKDNIIICQM